jgi:glycerophosphoryl diester phosphodiesterase
MTKDGVPVLFHNDNLDGKSSGTGPLKEYTLAELRQMDFGEWKSSEFKGTPIMTLEEFAENYFHLDLTFAIELKSAFAEKAVLDIIKKYGVMDKVFVTSGHLEFLRNMRALDKNIRLSLLVWKLEDAHIEDMKKINGSQLCPKACNITKELVDKVNASGMRVRAWGITDTDIMKEMCALDIDGMTINFPDKLYEYLKETNSAHLY